MSIEGRQLGDRGVEFQRMPPPAPPEAPRTVTAQLAVSAVLLVVGLVVGTVGAAIQWGGGAALLTAGLGLAVVGVLMGLGT